MSCFYPKDAWFAKRLNDNGRRPIVFNPNDGYRDMPLQVPCGKCGGCRAERSREWAVRMYHEAQMHEHSSFLTMTYAEPAPDNINKEDCQKFIKRLRKSFDVRYFITGEYGGLTHRPHYHAVIFGNDFKYSNTFKINEQLYCSPVLNEIWKHGQVACADFTMSAACYVAGYVNKKAGDTDTFNLMSTKPPLGLEWLKKYYSDLVKTGSVVVEGRELPIPREYFRWSEEKLPGDPLYPVKIERLYKFSKMTPEQRLDRYRELEAKEVYQKQRLQEQMYKEKL